jgi:hypothetical protein
MEIQLELLLGTQVYDSDDQPLGRLREIKTEAAGEDFVVVEYHLGALGLLESLSATTLGGVILRSFGLAARAGNRIIPWDKLDLADPDHLKLRCTVAELDAKP